MSDVSYEMLIIGPELYANEMQRFIDFKMSRGIVAHYFSTEFINRSFHGANLVSKIHKFVAYEYEQSAVKYLLLVGTYEQVPTKYVYSPSSEFDFADFNYKPTDWYYGVPDWDDSKIGLLGGNIPKIAVGRLPVNNEEELSRTISKIIAVEEDFKCKSILVFDGLNGALNSFLNLFSINHYVSDSNLKISGLNRILCGVEAGHVVSYTHGSPNALWTRTDENEWKMLMTCEDAKSINKTYGIHYLIACFAGALDLGSESLARALITSPTGPIVVIASSRVDIFDVQISSKFWEVFSETRDVGISFLKALQSYLCDQTIFSSKEPRFQKYNLYLTKVIYGDISWRITENSRNNPFDYHSRSDSYLETSLNTTEASSLIEIIGRILVVLSVFLLVPPMIFLFFTYRITERGLTEIANRVLHLNA
ncbi:MAG: C25 family cysteine peptidase [Candidatus Bathyarchaeia archaeon]